MAAAVIWVWRPPKDEDGCTESRDCRKKGGEGQTGRGLCIIYINKVVTNLGSTRFGRQEQVFKLPYLLISAGGDGCSDCYVLSFQRARMGVQTAMFFCFCGQGRALRPTTP